MADSPQRPPRPDEEDLVRFHNGDTLDNIPVVRLREDAAQRHPWLKWGGLAVLAGAVGALAGFGVASLIGGTSPQGADTAAHAAPTAAATSTTTASPETDSATPSASIWTAPSPSTEPPEITTQAGLEQVRVIQAPATGGDPSTSYCLVYTGSDSGGVKDAILLANTPAYQCTDLLPYDLTHGAFLTEMPECEPQSRAAVLSFADSAGWGEAVYFTCLTRHHGA